MKALYFRYCFGKIIEASMYSLAYNRLSNLLYAKKQQPLNCEAIPVFLIAW